MIGFIVPTFFLIIFSVFNLAGIKRQLLPNELWFILISLVAYILIKKIGRHFFRLNSHIFYWFFVLMLIVTYVVGIEAKGSRRWLDLYFFNFQASELFKIFFILFLSEFFARRQVSIRREVVYLLSLFYFILPTLIILKQPDLGTALVFFFVYTIMLFFSSMPRRFITYYFSLLFGIVPLAWFFLKSYQRDRLVSFLNPHLYESNASYNMIQAMITVGSGQFFGRGLGLGTQSNLFFLPENHTDFAFSSLIEQFGFFGGLILIILYSVLIIYLIRKIFKYFNERDTDAESNFLFTVGILAFMIFQIIVNIGMNLGIFPVAGITLPFISYGGSSLLAIMVGFALLP